MIPTWSIGVRRYVTGTEQTCHVNDMKSPMRPADASTSREKQKLKKSFRHRDFHGQSSRNTRTHGFRPTVITYHFSSPGPRNACENLFAYVLTSCEFEMICMLRNSIFDLFMCVYTPRICFQTLVESEESLLLSCFQVSAFLSVFLLPRLRMLGWIWPRVSHLFPDAG